MSKLKLADLPAHKRTQMWIESEIRHQEHKGIHTYCDCNHCGNCSRGGCCVDCWRGVLAELIENESKTSSINKF